LSTNRPLGQPRGVGKVILLTIVTLGIYGLVWEYKCYEELKRYRGQGVSGIVGVLLAFVVVTTFLLPAYVGRMYKEDGQNPPVTGWSGFWNLVPYVGLFIWQAKIQGALNNFWEGKQRTAAAPSASAPQPA